MDYWTEGRKKVEEVFFKDSIKLYAIAVVDNELNEELESEVLVGEYRCNIENGNSTVSRNETGSGSPQTLRISLPKGTPLDYRQTYKFKIKNARVFFDSEEWWRVDGWTEAQLSTVVSASRGVSV